eukprot:TRINITY_DN7495_c0_g1_i1.p1 TRINITY_DN7495_c0_g1~~TRINITY_DN7495_c0_g1_i1.p1  ORF type:complete len:128 (+),score=17.92 TRINITY_DN7495_c0_g1_i1:70-453(+)
MKRVLYDDKYIRIAQDHIELKFYYFPFGGSKIIPLSTIRRFYSAEERRLGRLEIKAWGKGLFSDIWWSWGNRSQIPFYSWDPSSQLILEIEDATMRCGCTVQNYPLVRETINDVLTRHENESTKIYE